MLISIPTSELKKLLVASGYITQKQFKQAEEEAKRLDKKIPDILIERGDISETYLVQLLADFFGVPFVDLKKEKIPQKVLEILPEFIAKDKHTVVFDKKDKAISLAMENPADLLALDFIKKKTDSDLKVYLATPSDIRSALASYKKEISSEFAKIIRENVSKAKMTGGDVERMAKDLPVIKIMDTILEYAAGEGASDIHFEPLANTFLVRFRIDGLLQDIIELPLEVHPALIARVKILANLKIDEHRIPQDGRFKFKMGDQDLAVRVSAMPTFYGEKVAMRLLLESLRLRSLEELGFSPKNLNLIKRNIEKTTGVIIICGPTGSGKTTTLYAILHILNKPTVNISTLEDPIEYDIKRINQIQVNPAVGLDFASGLKSIVRQDPDIIMVGEIRDKETAEMVIHAALTGHLVLTTLHTNDALGVIPRLLDLGVEAFLLSGTLTMAIAQRLTRRVCLGCIKRYKMDKETKKELEFQLKISGLSYSLPTYLYKGKGCNQCGGAGYKGQMGIFEVLEATPAMSQLMAKGASSKELEEEAKKARLITLLEDGLSKVEAGLTTIEEVLRVLKE